MIGFRKRQRSPAGRASAQQRELFEEDLREVVPNDAWPTAEELGALLRQTREQQGLSLGEMSRKTRIRDIYLRALEDGKMEKLPGTTFVAGFLRIYAETLDLTDKELVEKYLAGPGCVDENLQSDIFPAPTTSRHRPSVFVVLAGLVGLLGLFFFYENYVTIESLSTPAPTIPLTPPRRTDLPPQDTHGTSHPANVAKPEDRGEPPSSPSSWIQETAGDLSQWVTQSMGGASSEPLPDQGLSQEEGQEERSQEVIVLPSRAGPFLQNSLEQPDIPSARSDIETETVSKEPGERVFPEITADKRAFQGSVAKLEPPEPARLEHPEPARLEPPEPARLEPPEPARLEPPEPARLEPPEPARLEYPEPISGLELHKPIGRLVTMLPTVEAEPEEEQKNKTPEALIIGRYPEKVRSNSDMVPESTQAVSMLASELVWVQIQDAEGNMLKDMVMQPDHLFRIPSGGDFFAILGNAGAVRLRVGKRFLPFFGNPGEEIVGLNLNPEALLARAKERRGGRR